MRLYTFEINGVTRVGAERGERLVDLTAAGLPSDMIAFISAGAPAMEYARAVLASAAATSYPLAEVRVRAPILRPGKILCSGVNYKAHGAEEPDAPMPTAPGFFSKLPTAVVGPGDPIVHPPESSEVDYEVEFAVVIGRTMRRVPQADALNHVFGYTVLHDVSARDFQFRQPKDQNITLGKNFDTFAPLGPCIVTPDELPDPASARLRTILNGQVMQDATNHGWIFPLPYLLSYLSSVTTLEPGDVVSTGTPEGVGAFRHPPVWLKPGDHVVVEVEGIGRLENPVVAG